MERSGLELQKLQEEIEDLTYDPFAISDEDSSNDQIQELLSRKPKPIVVKACWQTVHHRQVGISVEEN